MPVAIGDYDPAWPDRFAEQQTALTELLGPWLAGPVQHVGSTAVPGLSAKPIIDMLAPVRSLTDAHAAVALLGFRDALRADERLRHEYAELKVELAQKHAENRNAYTNAKAAFVARVLNDAGLPAPHRDMLPE